MEPLIWAGIGLCLVNSAIFSGLNLALMGLSRLRLEAQVRAGSRDAASVLALRADSNRLLCTLLWGNVGVNVLLTLLSDSVMLGLAAFLFSTFGITIVGEIIPQAYFSRNAIRTGATLAPLVRAYLLILYPIAKPTAWVLDRWLGEEGIPYFRERDLRHVIQLHADAAESDVDRAEAQGALNFLDIDDVRVSEEGEPLHPLSVIATTNAQTLPAFERHAHDPFLMQVHASRQKWVVLVGEDGEPGIMLDADGFLRGALLDGPAFTPQAYCHRPILVRDPKARLGYLLRRLRVQPGRPADDVIAEDVILLWARGERRVLTGADLLGRLLRGISTREPAVI